MPLNQHLLRSGSYINGQWIENANRSFAVTNPANGELISELCSADTSTATAAIDAANKALPSWRALPAKKRAGILRRWFDLIMQHQDDLAAILTAEQGKPLAEAKSEIAYGANFIEWFAEESKRIYGDTIPGASADSRIVIIKQPVGIVAAITPWNFPNAMLTRKAAPALAAGCTFVVKAAGETPLSALALTVLAEQAGIPAGVFNVLASDAPRPIGAVLTSDPRVAKFSFTGSTEVGKILLAQCATTIKKTSMELGGNAPFIVFNDADIDSAIKGAMLSKFRNAGQTCVCTNRILVQEGVYQEFSDKLTTEVSALNLGAGDQAGVDIGPLVNAKAVNAVATMVDDAVAQGAKIRVGGHRGTFGDCFYQPTVITDVTSNMQITKQEIFGPVASLMRFDTEQQAIDIANDTSVGLSAYFYTRDIGRVWRVAEALECGMIGINESAISNEMAPFGGIKESGMGREGSKYGLDDFLEIKYLCLGGIEQ